MAENTIEYKALSAIDRRPLSANDLSTVLEMPESRASELVQSLAQAGLVKTLASFRTKVFSIGTTRQAVAPDEPLTLTFRGYLRVHPFFRKMA